MKKLIRNGSTKAFLTPTGDWTNDIAWAQSFSDQKSIHRAYSTYGLRNCELYYLFGDTPSDEYDFTIPLDDA